MSRRLTLSVFPTRDQDGLALSEKLVPMARELGFTVQEHFEPTVQEYTNACWNDDVVVLDATLTGKGQHNYEIAIPAPYDQVLVVSRSYLPINFYGLRDAIIDDDNNALVYGAPLYPNSLSNEDILRWLYLQLRDLLPSLPRDSKQKGAIGAILRGMPGSLDLVDNRRKQSGQVFISYRSNDWEEVERLKRDIEAGEFHNGQGKAVRCFPPNTLSDEVMTEQRRWQMLSMIDRFIGPADEIWAYESDNYYDSWWTLGELMTLAYRNKEGYRGSEPPKLLIFDPKQKRLHYAPDDYLPAMTRAQRRRMARWYANCDTAGIGAESIAAIRILALLPLIGRLRYFQDHVWSYEFWRHPILDCKICRHIGKQSNRVDVESFLWTRDPGFFRLTPQEIKQWVERQAIICPRCKSCYGLTQGPPHHLWMPVINGHRTGEYFKAIFSIESTDPEEYSLVPIPTYRTL
jgi:hypothetical protein